MCKCYWKDVPEYHKWVAIMWKHKVVKGKMKHLSFMHSSIQSKRYLFSLPPIDIIQCILSQEFPTFQVTLNKSSEKKLIKTQRKREKCVWRHLRVERQSILLSFRNFSVKLFEYWLMYAALERESINLLLV